MSQRAWKTTAAACIILIALLALDRAFFHVITGRGEGYGAEDAALVRGRLLGEGLRGHLAPRSRIFFFVSARSGLLDSGKMRYGPEQLQNMSSWSSWREGISKGLGDDTWQAVGCSPEIAAARGLSKALARQKGGIDAIISLKGLPPDLKNARISRDSSDRPKVAAHFVRIESVGRDLARKWLTDGHVEALVFEDDEGTARLYTAQQMP